MRALALTAVLLVVCATFLSGADAKKSADPYETLRATEIFAFGGVGVAGTRVPAELAFDEIVKKHDASALFRRLLASATPEGQLYALVGLHRIDRKKFDEVAPPYLSDALEVRVARGCTLSTEPAKGIVERIKAGDYK